MTNVDTKAANTSLIRKRILIIEKEPQFRISLARLLQREGYSVIMSGSVVQAEPYLTSLLIPLIIYDLNDPENNSFDDLCYLINHKQKPKVVVISSFDEIELQRNVLRLGAIKYCVKPFKKEVIIECIEGIL